MTLFSERFGLRPLRNVIQVDGMDDALRNAIWSVVVTSYLAVTGINEFKSRVPLRPLTELVAKIWTLLYKRPVDTIPRQWYEVEKSLRADFYKLKWYEVYDFIEFLPNHFADAYTRTGRGSLNDDFVRECNTVLAREMSGYRFAGQTLVRTTDQQELEAIEAALGLPGSMRVVAQHIDSAVRLMSDRQYPDYRNSIKESISAVEGFCSILAAQDKADLSAALHLLERRGALHPALKRAFSALYGYTSDADGIRHALLEESNLTYDDAKFMLVACSAFINYLKAAAATANIDLR